jgi:hypothetical protein
MSTTRTAAQLAVPPPRRPFDQLYDGTGPVGWIGDGRLAFTGFATLGDAAKAAWVAHVALERRRAKSRGEAAPHIEPELELWVSGADEWLTIEGKRVARLLSPASTVPEGDSWFGFELVFSPGTLTFDIESSAHVVYRGLRRSGVRWPMRESHSPGALRDSQLHRSSADSSSSLMIEP